MSPKAAPRGPAPHAAHRRLTRAGAEVALAHMIRSEDTTASVEWMIGVVEDRAEELIAEFIARAKRDTTGPPVSPGDHSYHIIVRARTAAASACVCVDGAAMPPPPPNSCV